MNGYIKCNISPNGILFEHKKECNTDTYYKVKKSEKTLSLVKEASHKGHRLYDSIYVKHPE